MDGRISIFREVGAESECLRSCYHNYNMATHLFVFVVATFGVAFRLGWISEQYHQWENQGQW